MTTHEVLICVEDGIGEDGYYKEHETFLARRNPEGAWEVKEPEDDEFQIYARKEAKLKDVKQLLNKEFSSLY